MQGCNLGEFLDEPFYCVISLFFSRALRRTKPLTCHQLAMLPIPIPGFINFILCNLRIFSTHSSLTVFFTVQLASNQSREVAFVLCFCQTKLNCKHEYGASHQIFGFTERITSHINLLKHLPCPQPSHSYKQMRTFQP